ncbi:MAG: DNA-binding protein [Actinobacteria bacterium]|nr:DNA-binding protein [Actinomycetota bacterium]
MQTQLLHDADGLRTFAVVFDKGDEAKQGLTSFAVEQRITAASLTAIGAFKRAVLAYFDRDTKRYLDIPIDEQVEALSLVGDIALHGDEPEVHAHVVVGHPDGTTLGGHLQQGVVWPTLEVIVEETPAHLHKRVDPDTGLALIDLPPADR